MRLSSHLFGDKNSSYAMLVCSIFDIIFSTFIDSKTQVIRCSNTTLQKANIMHYNINFTRYLTIHLNDIIDCSLGNLSLSLSDLSSHYPFSLKYQHLNELISYCWLLSYKNLKLSLKWNAFCVSLSDACYCIMFVSYANQDEMISYKCFMRLFC